MSGQNEVNVKLIGGVEYEEVAFNEEKEVLVMASVKAPLFEQNPEDKRAPIDLCFCVDRSGSMAGDKLNLVKQAMHFVLKNMDNSDSLSIVTYDTNVKTLFDYTKMDKAGKAMATDMINDIISGDSTNLSGGLLQGMELALKRKNPNDISSVLLFTDGLANHGVTETTKITAAMQAVQDQQRANNKTSESTSNANNENGNQNKTTTVFTFGFGSDHDEKMLRAIAEAGFGMYYFVSDVDKIPTSFADCLGGLQSVVAQNITLSVEPQGGVVLLKSLSTKYRTSEGSLAENNITLDLNDLYSEEERDLIFLVKLPALPAERPEEHDIVNFNTKYFNVLTTQPTETTGSAKIRRPGTVNQEAKPNGLLDQQRNRLKVAEAMETARNTADAGQFNQAREIISKAKEFVEKSSTSEVAFCQKLVKELDECTSDLANKEYYKNEGSKKMSRKEQSHHYQRSNKIADEEQDFYETKMKANYKMMSKSANSKD